MRDRRTRPAPLLIGLLVAIGLCAGADALAGPPEPVAQTPSAASSAQLILHVLDYVAVDYAEAVKDGAVADQAEYDEQLEFALQARSLLGQLAPSPEHASLAADADGLVALVRDQRPAGDVAAAAGRLRSRIIAAYGVQTAPRRPPDVGQAGALYASRCATCHGPEGRGDGQGGKGLDPPPANFHDHQRMAQRSLYGLYSTITLGVSGTGMAAFAGLTDDERWSLAFYVADLGHTGEDSERGAELWRAGRGKAPFHDLASIASASPQEIEAQHGRDAAVVLSYLRRHPELVAASATGAIADSIRLLRDSVIAYRDGRGQRARELAASSYLDGFEPVEAALDARDTGLRTAVESGMMRYRELLRDNAPVGEVEAQAAATEALLIRAREQLAGGDLPAQAVFISAMVILLREGLEAILIVAAIYALLMRAGRRDGIRYLHGGWIAALLAGVLTWAVASYAIAMSGATREMTEGVSALVAAGVLLYVGFWMHDKGHAQRWQAYLDRRLAGALGAGALWTMALVSFLAVYREVFETILFYETLAMQAGPDGRGALLGGLGAGAAGLAALGILVVRGSARLPMGLFFRASAALIALLAVVLAGKGIAALQAAGWIPAHHVSFPSAPLLGVYPSLQGLLAQAVLVVIIAATFTYGRGPARRSP